MLTKIHSIAIIFIILLFSILTGEVFADANLTPEQLVLLMKGSREQYNTIDAKMKETSYQYDPNDRTKRKIRQTRDIISRWTRNKHFSRTIETTYQNEIANKDYSSQEMYIYTYLITPEWSKSLEEEPGKRTPRGRIVPGRYLENESPFYNIYTAMWGFFGCPWEKMNLNEAQISYDEKSNYYIMKVKMGESSKLPWITLYIDPSKSFIPVNKEFTGYDGTVFLRYECNDFRQTETGLWIPYRYSWFDPRLNYGGVFEVEKATVNQPIADNLLDFDFPKGTIVYDERLNVQYIVDDANKVQETIVDPCSIVETDTSITAPVKEQELIASALKVKELLQEYKPEQTTSPAVEVLPTVVLVTPGQSEYKLSVTKSDGTKPALMNYKFESSDLELSSLENLIDSKGQLIIKINRIQSHTGFAKGILSLQFTDEKETVEITFVSAPLENAP